MYLNHSAFPVPAAPPSRSKRPRARTPISAVPQRSISSPSAPPRKHPRRKTRQFYYFTLLSEASLKLVINGLLLSAFSVGLVRLVPEMVRHHQQRVAIEAELAMTQTRVDHLREEFNRTFDPRGSAAFIEGQGYQLDAQKRPIVFVDPTAP